MKHTPLFAWATLLPDGAPNIIGVWLPALNAHTPLVAFKRDTIEGMRAFALNHGRKMKQPVYLVRFDSLEILESHPDPAAN